LTASRDDELAVAEALNGNADPSMRKKSCSWSAAASATRRGRGTTQYGRGSNWIETTLKKALAEGDAEE
jgi:hypothetical protein